MHVLGEVRLHLCHPCTELLHGFLGVVDDSLESTKGVFGETRLLCQNLRGAGRQGVMTGCFKPTRLIEPKGEGWVQGGGGVGACTQLTQ